MLGRTARNPAAYGLSVVVVVVGLAGLLAAEAGGAGLPVVSVGGVVVLVGVGVLTALVAALPAPEDH